MLPRVCFAMALFYFTMPVGSALGQLDTRFEGSNVAARPGATVNLTTRLMVKVQRTYIGFAARPVKFYYRWYVTANNYVWVSAGTVYTDRNGYATIQVKTPGLPGRRFVYDVVFEGDGTGRRAYASYTVSSR